MSKLNQNLLVKNLEKSLLEKLREFYEKNGSISDDLLESLYLIYKKPLYEALAYLDNHEDKTKQTNVDAAAIVNSNNFKQHDAAWSMVYCLVQSDENSNTGNDDDFCRKIYQVRDSMGISYYVFENATFCSCGAFKKFLLDFSGGADNNVYCKHIILVKLADALGKISIKKIAENKFAEILKQMI